MEIKTGTDAQLIGVLLRYIRELETKTINLEIDLDIAQDKIQCLGKLLICANHKIKNMEHPTEDKEEINPDGIKYLTDNDIQSLINNETECVHETN